MAEVFFNGPAGRIEGRYHKSVFQDAPIALVLHPNPQLGGTMNNKVVYTMYQAFVTMGFSVLRFNFRGVGKSQGVFDGEPENELADTLAAWDWLKRMNVESAHCWISGYSFGAMLGLTVLMRRPDISGFVAVSPPADVCDFSFVSPCPASGLIIQGGMDTVVSEPAVMALAEKLDAYRKVQVDYALIEQADHLYTDQLKKVYDCMVDRIPKLMTPSKKLKKQHILQSVDK